jgi:hypothetical protein
VIVVVVGSSAICGGTRMCLAEPLSELLPRCDENLKFVD